MGNYQPLNREVIQQIQNQLFDAHSARFWVNREKRLARLRVAIQQHINIHGIENALRIFDFSMLTDGSRNKNKVQKFTAEVQNFLDDIFNSYIEKQKKKYVEGSKEFSAPYKAWCASLQSKFPQDRYPQTTQYLASVPSLPASLASAVIAPPSASEPDSQYSQAFSLKYKTLIEEGNLALENVKTQQQARATRLKEVKAQQEARARHLKEARAILGGVAPKRSRQPKDLSFIEYVEAIEVDDIASDTRQGTLLEPQRVFNDSILCIRYFIRHTQNKAFFHNNLEIFLGYIKGNATTLVNKQPTEVLALVDLLVSLAKKPGERATSINDVITELLDQYFGHFETLGELYDVVWEGYGKFSEHSEFYRQVIIQYFSSNQEAVLQDKGWIETICEPTQDGFFSTPDALITFGVAEQSEKKICAEKDREVEKECVRLTVAFTTVDNICKSALAAVLPKEDNFKMVADATVAGIFERALVEHDVKREDGVINLPESSATPAFINSLDASMGEVTANDPSSPISSHGHSSCVTPHSVIADQDAVSLEDDGAFWDDENEEPIQDDNERFSRKDGTRHPFARELQLPLFRLGVPSIVSPPASPIPRAIYSARECQVPTVIVGSLIKHPETARELPDHSGVASTPQPSLFSPRSSGSAFRVPSL